MKKKLRECERGKIRERLSIILTHTNICNMY
jgi:hypothetical protein